MYRERERESEKYVCTSVYIHVGVVLRGGRPVLEDVEDLEVAGLGQVRV